MNQTSNETVPENFTEIDPTNVTKIDPHLFNETLKFVFSKDIDSLPITRTELSDGLPCVKEPGYRTKKDKKQRLEIERSVYSRCTPSDDGTKSIDDRYTNL